MSTRVAPVDGDLYRRLVWVTLFRVGVITVLLLATAAYTFSEQATLAEGVVLKLYGLTAVLFAASLGYAVAIQKGPTQWLPAVAYVQVAGDVGLAAFLVWLTGGGDSPFSFLFSFGVINAAILRFRRGALLAAGGSVVAFAAVTITMWAGVLPPAATYLAPVRGPLGRLAFGLFANTAAFFLIAVLGGYLAEQVRRTRAQLSEAVEDFAALSQLHERIVESVSSGILTTDESGALTFLNHSGQEILGIGFRGHRGRPLAELLPGVAAAIARLGERGLATRGEEAVVGPDGLRHLGYSVAPLSGEGEVGGAVAIFQDLTELKRMENLVRRNERLAAVGSLAAGLAHEIRNPLASMSGSVELLRSSLPEDDDSARLMGIVLRETERLDGLIRDFLGFARPAPPQRREVDLGRLVSETLEVFQNDPVAGDCELDSRVEPGLVVDADDGQLRQILMNLLLNAAQAVDGAGRLTVLGRRADGEMRLSVGDDGPGMDAETARHIFDPFFTTKDAGSGLGLALVHRMVEAHGGRVEVDSAPGRGTRIEVILPDRPETE